MRRSLVLLSSLVCLAAAATQPKPLLHEGFDDDQLLKRGWYDGGKFRISGGSHAGNGCLEYEWTDKKAGVSGSSPVRHLFEPTDEIYIRFYLKLSKGFGWTGKNFHPHLIQFMTTENHKFMGPAATRLTLYVEPVNGKLRLAAQDIQNKDAPHGLTQGPIRGGFNGKFYDSRDVLFTDDQWHCIDARFKLNTLGKNGPNTDGILQAWFDGKLVVDERAAILRSQDFPDMKINQLLIAPYFGPGLLPGPQKLWFDELTLSTRRLAAPAPAADAAPGR